jgi:hypothetical protein
LNLEEGIGEWERGREGDFDQTGFLFDEQHYNLVTGRNANIFFYVFYTVTGAILRSPERYFKKLSDNIFKFFENCLIIYIKKPYFCVPKLATRFICGLTTF